MKKLLIPALLGLGLAGPAHATGGLVCSTAGPRPLQLWLVISHTTVPVIVSARLSDEDQDIPVVTAQSWLDQDVLRVDLVDPNAVRHELRVRAARRGDTYDGSVWRNGKRRWVRCREG